MSNYSFNHTTMILSIIVCCNFHFLNSFNRELNNEAAIFSCSCDRRPSLPKQISFFFMFSFSTSKSCNERRS